LTARNLNFASGHNVTLGADKNLVLGPLTEVMLLLLQDVTARGMRTVRLLQDASARGMRSVHLPQDASARGGRHAHLRQGASARGGRVTLLAADRLRALALREQALGQDLHAFARAGYRLFALDLATHEETELGFLPAEGPLTLTGVAIADGDYEIRVRSDGGYWRDARHATAFPLRIADGEVVTPLPAAENLRYDRIGNGVLLSWTWSSTSGAAAPQQFAVWTAASEPVDTAGEPDQLVPATQPGGYSVTIPDTTGQFYAVVRARRDGKQGPAATTAIPAHSPPPASPENQTARFDRD